MSDGNAYFNGRQWRRLLQGDEQAVRFLEALWQRSGGGQAPDVNLDQVVNLITQVDNSVRQMGVELNTVRRIAQSASESEQSQLMGKLKRLEQRLAHMENETHRLHALEYRINQHITDGIRLHVKPLVHRINQLEDAQ